MAPSEFTRLPPGAPGSFGTFLDGEHAGVLSAALERTFTLDLTGPFAILLRDGWTLPRADLADVTYRRYLALRAAFPDTPLCPVGDIDAVWHAHLLHPEAYVRDCQHLFGGLLPHDPHLGTRGPEDEARWKAAIANTTRLFHSEFGLDMMGNGPGYGRGHPMCG